MVKMTFCLSRKRTEQTDSMMKSANAMFSMNMLVGCSLRSRFDRMIMMIVRFPIPPTKHIVAKTEKYYQIRNP